MNPIEAGSLAAVQGLPIIVISGPSGVGKGSVIRELSRLFSSKYEIHFNVSWTTRPMRPREIDGMDYHFEDKAEFQAAIDEGKFLEYENVHGNLYGSPAQPLIDMVTIQGRIGILDIDCAGAARLRTVLQVVGGAPNQDRRFPVSMFDVFLRAPLETIRARLQGREMDSHEVIERRMERAPGELARQGEFSCCVDNSLDDHGVAAAAQIFRDYKQFLPA